MKLKIEYAVRIEDKYGTTIQIFDTEKHAQEFVNALDDVNIAKV